jgi:hypothetical protein
MLEKIGIGVSGQSLPDSVYPEQVFQLRPYIPLSLSSVHVALILDESKQSAEDSIR